RSPTEAAPKRKDPDRDPVAGCPAGRGPPRGLGLKVPTSHDRPMMHYCTHTPSRDIGELVLHQLSHALPSLASFCGFNLRVHDRCPVLSVSEHKPTPGPE